MPVSVRNRTVRRSRASAIAPPQSGTTSSGTGAASPSIPTASVEWVSSYSWNGTATVPIWPPSVEIAWPIQRLRKSRWRSGRVSIASRASRPGRSPVGTGSCGGTTSVVGDALEQQVVAPLAGDLQVPPGEADAREPVLLEHALRADVVDERPGLEPVQAELVEGVADELADRARREPASVARLGDPVADVPTAERAVGDVRERDRAGDLGAVADREAETGAPLDPAALALDREERVLALRLEGCEELLVRAAERMQLLRVLPDQRADDAQKSFSASGACAVDSSS